jgi:deoxycytidylate deaminase
VIKPDDPRDLAIALLSRSTCSVQVAAVLADRHGIFAWGWNSVGSGYGEHAECAAIRRANRDRLVGATIYVASQRNRNKKPVLSKPCDACDSRIVKAEIGETFYRDQFERWICE